MKKYFALLFAIAAFSVANAQTDSTQVSNYDLFIQNVMGVDTVTFWSYFFFTFVGVGISLYGHVSKRDKESTETPKPFNPLFLVWDNFLRLLSTSLFLYLCLRAMDFFFPDFLTMSNASETTGTDIARILFCATLGYSNDKISQLLKDKTSILDMPRKIFQTLKKSNENNGTV